MVCFVLLISYAVCPLPSLSRMRMGPLSWTLFGRITLYGICISNLPGISLFVKFSNKLADAV